MTVPELNDDQIRAFREDGYLLLPGWWDADLVDTLHRIALADKAVANAGGLKDSKGGQSKLYITAELTGDAYSAIAHSRRMVHPLEQVMGEPVRYYHHKMMLKEPRVGGAWEWHQDYGYWYNDGFLLPDMVSCMIAVDRATRANGCLQVMRGSHKLGRLEHGVVGGQTGADERRVEAALERMELVYCEMEPGTAVIFHANTLHRSEANTSEHARWSLICCYATAANEPVEGACKGKAPARIQPVQYWDDAQVRHVADEQLTAGMG